VETWTNVWACTNIPSVQEILVIRTASIGVQLLRRAPDRSWPEVPLGIEAGDLELESVGFRVAVAALYAGTWLVEATGSGCLRRAAQDCPPVSTRPGTALYPPS
jgi:hypothetical protein